MKKIDLNSRVVLLTRFRWVYFLLLSYFGFAGGFWLIGMFLLPNLYYLFVCLGLALFIASIFLWPILIKKINKNKLNKLKNTGLKLIEDQKELLQSIGINTDYVSFTIEQGTKKVWKRDFIGSGVIRALTQKKEMTIPCIKMDFVMLQIDIEKLEKYYVENGIDFSDVDIKGRDFDSQYGYNPYYDPNSQIRQNPNRSEYKADFMKVKRLNIGGNYLYYRNNKIFDSSGYIHYTIRDNKVYERNGYTPIYEFDNTKIYTYPNRELIYYYDNMNVTHKDTGATVVSIGDEHLPWRDEIAGNEAEGDVSSAYVGDKIDYYLEKATNAVNKFYSKEHPTLYKIEGVFVIIIIIFMTITMFTNPMNNSDNNNDNQYYPDINDSGSDDNQNTPGTNDNSNENNQNNNTNNKNENVVISKINYSLQEENGNLYYVVSGYENNIQNIVIESSIDGYPVKSIGEKAFDGLISLESIVIPESITSIGGNAFEDCDDLINVYYNGSISNFDKMTIKSGNSSLTSATWYYLTNDGKDETKVGDWYYYDTDGKTIITICNYDISDISFTDYKATYSGENYEMSILGELPEGVEVKYYYNDVEFSGAINAGEYEITAKFIAKDSTYNNLKDLKAKLTISKATYDMSNINFNDTSYVYDGETKTISLVGELPSGVSVNYYCNNEEFNGAINVGVYEVTAKFTSSNYNTIEDMTATLTINKATYDMSNISFNHTSYVYDGETKTISLVGKLPSGVSVKYYCNNEEFNGAINVGVYEVTAKFTSSDYNYKAIENLSANLYIYNESIFSFSKNDKTASISSVSSTTTSFYIPKSIIYNDELYILNSIGNKAFETCRSLTSITISSSVTSIGEYAFWYCSGLTSVTFEEGSQLTSIGADAFGACHSLTSITIPNSVTSIGEYAFSSCSSLTSVTFEEGSQLTSIGSRAFQNCSNLTSIVIPSSVTSIDGSAFYGCPKLTSVTFEEGSQLTSIASHAFDGCSSLTSITIPSSVTSIASYAFDGCSSLTSITIPSSVTSIDPSAFKNCSSLSSIVIEEGNTVYDSRNNCNAIIKTTTNTLLFGCQNTTIPSSVTSIGSSAFNGCSSLTSITIPSSVTSIDPSAFRDCSRLTSITIPNSVTSIGSTVFSGCSSLTSVTFEDGSQLTSIDDYVFYNCYWLTSITIPSSVTSIDYNAFEGCSNLTSITIPNSVTSIRSRAFRDCYKLTDVYFKGTAEEWNAITIYSDNNYLTTANRHYYSETKPTDTTNSYWHYDTDGITPVLWTNQ